MAMNLQSREDPSSRRNQLRLRAEIVAAEGANSAWTTYHSDARLYTATEVAESLEEARVFLSAALALPPTDDSAADRRCFIGAALAALCDGAHRDGRRRQHDSAAPQTAPHLTRIKDALISLLTAAPPELPRGFSFLARSLLRPGQEPIARQRMIAHLRHAQACLFVFGTVRHDAPTDRI